MENIGDVHKNNELPVSSTTHVNKNGTITKCFDLQAVDDIIESFDVSEITTEDCDDNSDIVYPEKNKHLFKHHQLPNVHLDEILKATSKKNKQYRSQVNMKHCYYVLSYYLYYIIQK